MFLKAQRAQRPNRDGDFLTTDFTDGHGQNAEGEPNPGLARAEIPGTIAGLKTLKSACP